jgi:hypothetical protein
MNKTSVYAPTVKSREYQLARGDFLAGDAVTVEMAALLLGYTEKTIRNWAAKGKYGAIKRRGTEGGPERYVFNRAAIAAEMGIDLNE